MKTRNIIYMIGASLLLSTGGIAGAAQPLPLPAATIPQFVEQLPLLEFEFINATRVSLPGVLSGLPALGSPDGGIANGGVIPSQTFNVDAEEFRSQILPSKANWPAAPVTCGPDDTASSTWGYRTGSNTGIDAGTGIHTTYLGPVVIAETGVEATPIYGNNLPAAGIVQANLPIDFTLDWADPAGTTGPVGCQPDPNTGAYGNPLCGLQGLPWSGEIPIATHLHGGEVAPAYDGGPDAWFTQGNTTVGAGWPGPQYSYPNNQQEGTIWFHDHALGITRLNVYAGLAGLMPIIDPANPPLTPLPQLTDGYDIPLIIQDRTFAPDCEIMYNLASNPQPNPTVHPFWIPEFIGDTIVVNGKTWPVLDVEPRQYRFRLVNGSNSRFYDLTIQEARIGNKGKIKTNAANALPMLAIATDDGYLMKAASTPNIVIGTGERYEIIVDFSAALPGQQFLMMNSARTPFPGGGAVIKGLTDRVMMFNVVADAHPLIPSTTVVDGSPLRDPVTNPIELIETAHDPLTGSITRQLTLNEVIGAGGPLELVVNNSKFNLVLPTPGCQTTACRETEIPAVGDTEIWEIINITADAHPMHTHLTSFQVIDRTPFQAGQWIANYDALLLAAYPPPQDPGGKGPPLPYSVKNADGAIGGNPEINPFLQLRRRRLPLPSEKGWKDTVITYPGEVTRIAVRWAPTDMPATGPGAPVVGVNSYVGFDPTALVPDPNDQTGATLNVGYVWHCHIIDHEDNEMMRNYTVGAGRQPVF
jgi:FtsP/CotA-like multicopper oxidase with cupredoxin domain